MLIVKIYVNNRQIDQINIHNTGQRDQVTGSYIYEVVDRTDKRILSDTFRHDRKRGYRPLLMRVLGMLEIFNIKESV